MRTPRLDAQILIYFLLMVTVVIVSLGLNYHSRNSSLDSFTELLDIYARVDIVHALSADMSALQLEVTEYNDHTSQESLVALEELRTDVLRLLGRLADSPLTKEEAEAATALEHQLSDVFDLINTQITPRLEQISSLHQQIRSDWGGLFLELEQIGERGPSREDSLELAPIFQTMGETRTQTEVFIVSPEAGLEDDAYADQRYIAELVEEFTPYYQGALEAWHDKVADQYVLTNQLVQVMRAHLYSSNVLLANRIAQMGQSVDAIEALYTNHVEQALTDNRESVERQEFQFFVLALLSGFMAILLSGIVSRQIARPIHSLVDVFHDLSSGKRVTKIPMIHRQDDFGKLARAAETLRHKNEDTQYLLHQSQSLVKELQQLNSELSEQVAVREMAEQTLAQRQEELERSNRDLSQFAYAASHDLQEPLRMVSSYLQLLERRYKDQLDDDAKDFIHFAVDGATRMKNLIRSLLDYSRIGTHGGDFKELNLNLTLKSVTKNLEVLINESDAEIVSQDLPIVWGDEAQLQTLVQNIVTNSIHYRSENKPHIEIGCVNAKDHYEISIKDNGIGFDQKFSDKIFTIFQRLHSKSKEIGGTGIGLALCKRIVERHEGRIWAESTPGEGTTIFFTLPVKGPQVGGTET